MRASAATRLLMVLGLLAAVWLGLWGAGQFAPDETEGGGARGGAGDPLLGVEEEIFLGLESTPGLRGLPGIEHRLTGVGLITGAVMVHVPGEGPKPLPGVELHVVGSAQGEPRHLAPVESGEDGRFTFVEVPAGVGYVVLLDHAPYRRIVVRGLSVGPDRATDVGTLLLGAPTTLAGEVVDSKGRSVHGARVQVLRDASRAQAIDLRRALFELQMDTAALAEAEVDTEGRFVLEDLPPGRYVLRVSAHGYATTFRSGVLVTLDEHSSAVRVVLDPGAGFAGRVLDETGRGLAAARVIAVALPGRNLERFDRVEAVTDGSGAYRLDQLIPGMTYGLEAWAEGYAPTGSYVREVSGMQRRDWKLQPSGRIEGRVVDADTGEGIGDCQVTVLAGPLTGVSPVSTMTDAAGGFLLPHVNPGPVLLFAAKARGYQPGDRFNAASVQGLQVRPQETTWIDWTLKAGGAVQGRVTSSGQRPVPYAALALVDRRRGRQRWTGEITALTDADGQYRLVGVQPGEYDLRVTAAGHAAPSDPAQTHVRMGPDLGEVRKDLVLDRGAVIEGSVATPEGNAARGARVWLEPADGGTGGTLRDLHAVSGADGTFRISGVPPRADVHVRAEHDAWVRSAPTRLRLGAGQQRRITLVLREGAMLPGRVVDVRGVPVGGARVRWGNVDGVAERELRSSFEADEHLGSRVVRTDGDGRFELKGLAPGTLLLKVEKEGFSAWYRRDLAIGEEGLQAALTIALTGTLTVRGRVVSEATGRPLARAFVYARERSAGEGVDPDPGRVQAVVSTETDGTGRYVLDKVPPGLHDIVVWFAEGHIAAMQQWRHPNVRKRDVAAGAQGVDFELAPIPLPEEAGR